MRDFFRTLVPERFEADVWVHADGSYTYSYDGNLIFVLRAGSYTKMPSGLFGSAFRGAA